MCLKKHVNKWMFIVYKSEKLQTVYSVINK